MYYTANSIYYIDKFEIHIAEVIIQKPFYNVNNFLIDYKIFITLGVKIKRAPIYHRALC